MAIFGTRSALQRVLKGDWRNDDEKMTLLSQMREESGVKAVDLLPLVWHPDPAVRAARPGGRHPPQPDPRAGRLARERAGAGAVGRERDRPA